MIFVDSNIPMHLIGAAYPHKIDPQRLLERFVVNRERLVTDAEVLQDLLHRYGAIGRRDAIQPAFDALLGVVDAVLPVRDVDVLRAREIVLGNDRVSARDVLHLAIMEQHSATRIMSFDQGFDGIPGVARLA